ncbi:hypothetical protein JHL18_04495 [Clostridium sp. YIM B02505]|uniref:Uncharacterized protein n=1 Tax=Clostridium yunnanense TaxID=2800325 RepID=A0ABS1EKK9_9CLOT|nr:hypothetical protein [Clostridium yunnanense]MBK1809899.1 hypothetical protein [Clostridium yunnanense]
MPKIFWYYCVVAIGIGFLIFTVIKKKDIINLLSFFLSVASLGYLCEVLVLFVLDSYAYKPGVFSDPTAENILGHLICNGFFWGGIAVFVAAFSLRAVWIAFISIAFMLVEIWFLKVGAYEHHWWKLYITGAAAFVIFTFSKKWLSALKENKHKLVRKLTFFMTAWIILQSCSVLQSLFDKQHFLIGLVQNVYRDSILFSVPYQLCVAIIYSAFVSIHNKWYYTIFPLVINLIADSLFAFLKILNFYNGWNLFYFEFIRIMGFIIFILLEKYTLLYPSPSSKNVKG